MEGLTIQNCVLQVEALIVRNDGGLLLAHVSIRNTEQYLLRWQFCQ